MITVEILLSVKMEAKLMTMKDMRGAIIPPANYSKGIPPVIIVSGTNYEMGYQYSEQLAPKIYSLLKRLQTSCYSVYEEKTLSKAERS